VIKNAALINTRLHLSFMDGVQFDIKVITGGSNSAIDSIVGGLGRTIDKANGVTGALEKIGKSAFYLNNISQAISGVSNDFDKAIQPGITFNTSLKELQAITGVTDEGLNKIGNSARKLAKEFGIDAAGAVDSYKMYLSKLSPELAKAPAQLDLMGKYAVILGKQLGGDTAGATDILTTAMNQYGVSVANPLQATKAMAAMMNIMSSAAQEGSAELPEIKSALEQSGMMAKTANVSFAELNASIQVLDKAGKKGAEGGVAVRNVLAELSQGKMMPRQTLAMLQAAHIDVQKLSDTSLSFSQRLKYLSPIVNDNAAMVKLFGKENVSAGIALVKNTGEIDRLTGKIVGTNSATEMANTIMGGFSERMARVNARLKDVGISIFNATEGFIPFVKMGMGGLQVMANLAQASSLFSMIARSRLIPSVAGAIVSMGSWIATTVMATAAQLGLNAAMYANPIGVIVLAVVAAIAAVAALIHWWDEIWGAIKAFGAWVWEHNPFKFLIDVVDTVFPGFKKALSALWDWVAAKFEALIGWIKKAWGWIKSLFGSDTKDVTKAAVQEFADNAKNIQIEGITLQGKAEKSTALKDYDPNKKKGKQGTELASNITAGGSRPTTIHLTIQKVQGIGEVKTTNMRETAKQAGDQVVEQVLMALQSVHGKVSYE
jgi:TP901 family phage tail tape measure protein